jgi:sugar phosphate isomerase/epimerase
METKPTPKTILSMNQNYPGVPLKRRDFLHITSALAVTAGIASRLSALAAELDSVQPNTAKLDWKLSVQHYTYRNFSVFEAMDMSAAVGLRYFEVRSNLKLGPKWPGKNADEAMPEDASKEFKAKLVDRGLSIPSVFGEFNGKPNQAKRLFEFWKNLGTEIIVAEPPADSFDMLEKLCEEYKMKLAIHNHQRTKSEYWSPDIVLGVCANRSKLIGWCADVGQWARSGLDPVECLRKLEGRVINYHLKDVLKKGDLDSRNTVMGEGEADCANTLKELKRQGYQGVIAIDFEHDTPALQKDMVKNVDFVENQAKLLL